MSPPDDMPASRLVIAIDGPAASGKSSTAQWVATELGLQHVDSGAFYRAATAAALRVHGSPERWTARDVLVTAASITLSREGVSFVPTLPGGLREDEMRGAAVTRHVSRVAQMPEVRAWVNAQVRTIARDHDVVVDGRDMGTAVFPSASLKVYLVADPWERARRRLAQLLQRRPTDAEIAEETDRLVHRDASDATQSLQARDAVLIDTTALTQQDQVARIVALARAAIQRSGETGGG